MNGWHEFEVDHLSFASFSEAVNGLEILSERRPDLLKLLADRLWTLLPPCHRWKFDPKKDMSLPSLLLRLVSHPEFSSEDAGRVKAGLASCLTPKLIVKCRTVDILWTAWAFLAFDADRALRLPTELGQYFPANLQTAVIEALEARASEKANFDELRTRLALLGLLSLMGVAPTRERASSLYSRHAWGL